eukprot:COSAG06_NODE_3972_length_4702_cov_5.129046_3_plen_117_part_00
MEPIRIWAATLLDRAKALPDIAPQQTQQQSSADKTQQQQQQQQQQRAVEKQRYTKLHSGAKAFLTIVAPPGGQQQLLQGGQGLSPSLQQHAGQPGSLEKLKQARNKHLSFVPTFPI